MRQDANHSAYTEDENASERVHGIVTTLAHTRNAEGKRHDLVEHLQAVAVLASQFASAFGAARLAYYMGLWHDTGKFHPDFQAYLLESEAGNRLRSVDHKAAGVRLAIQEELGPLSLSRCEKVS